MQQREKFGVQYVRAAWGLLTAIERDETELAGDISEAWDPLRLQESLAIVAQVLMVEIRNHAEDRGCGCGSLEWIERMALRAASRADDG